ncbi:MAG TPA: hypothetical protein VFK86_09595 [Bauldia sp.]|nr:hypothetical protein [Bauldia sp.]
MHAVVRTYAGASAKEVFDVLEARKTDVERVIRAVPGFVSYSLIRTNGGGTSVTVCQDKAGADRSVEVARDWIKANVSHVLASDPPSISEGSVILQLN